MILLMYKPMSKIPPFARNISAVGLVISFGGFDASLNIHPFINIGICGHVKNSPGDIVRLPNRPDSTCMRIKDWRRENVSEREPEWCRGDNGDEGEEEYCKHVHKVVHHLCREELDVRKE